MRAAPTPGTTASVRSTASVRPTAAPRPAAPERRAAPGLPDPQPQSQSQPQPAGRSQRLAGVATMIGSGLSTQTGAAIGSLAFPVLGPVGVVAVRQYVAAVVLLAVARPRLRSFTWWQWRPVLLLALVFGTMNLSLYSAIDRIGLGLAVTLEFLGPLAIALTAARRRVDVCAAIVAAAGVVTLMRPQPSTDYAGMALGLLAAACWASYILLNRTVGQRVPGAQGSAAASGLSALMFLPVGLDLVLRHPPTAEAVGYAVAAGVLASAVPYLADMFTLRRVPAQAFGLFMSVNPVLAAVVGLLGLGQHLGWTEWASIGAIVAANSLSIATRRT
ncbi:EamA family transporter [Streptomyces phaeochromogenes]|uniref:EamA family transporter n=1 Tax=Streptomyces phaeochromogenes TaxID=1923 RepID=A0ABZ1HRI1_STRPH|nr:EamA family transporter [Streptomyces phaeochromogenes]WSD19825.1 EamA family transporter [Streptomyces phaeochromogenes]